MTCLYHGTNQENSEAILQEGFRSGTYFAMNMADALFMGGPYVFTVFVDQDFDPNVWQKRFDHTIEPHAIVLLIHMPPTLIHWNPQTRTAVNRAEVKKAGREFCESCGGRGQLENYPPLYRGGMACTSCDDCGGHGFTKD